MNEGLHSDSDHQLVEAADTTIRVGRRAIGDGADMDITPMIDITFLLLIFFLVASRMEDDAVIELPPARHGTAVAARSAATLTVIQGTGDKTVIYLGDGKSPSTMISTEDRHQQEERIRQFVEGQTLGTNAKKHVLLKAERGLKHREVARVARAVGRATDVPLYVAVLEE